MKYYDFKYDDLYLSDFGFIICQIGSPSELDVVSAGSQITFNTINVNNGKRHYLIDAKYDERITATFQICKNPCLFTDLEITNDELRKIMRWLNRKSFLKFSFVDNESDDSDFYYEASFNISMVKVGSKVCGLELNMATNSPFAFHETISIKKDNLTYGTSLIVKDYSDEIGYIYPKVICDIKKLPDSKILNLIFEFNNQTETIVIKNCIVGEKIIIQHPFINTSVSGHDIMNDFNFVFPKIQNNVHNNINSIKVGTSGTEVNIEVQYKPLVKVGI